MKYNIPVSWSEGAIMAIEAKSLAEAVKIACVLPCPDGAYIEDSFRVEKEFLCNHNDLNDVLMAEEIENIQD